VISDGLELNFNFNLSIYGANELQMNFYEYEKEIDEIYIE